MDRSEYSSVDAQYWYNKGREEEREKIVAWLQAQQGVGNSDEHTAFCIEAGEHLK